MTRPIFSWPVLRLQWNDARQSAHEPEELVFGTMCDFKTQLGFLINLGTRGIKHEITQTLIYIARTDPPVHNRCLVPKGYIPSAFLLSTDGSKEFYSFTLHLQSVNPTTGDVTSNLMFASSNTSHHVVPANEILGKCAFK